MDPSRAVEGYEIHRLPRSRGDGPHGTDRTAGPRRAPPLTRGWTRDKQRLSCRDRGSPAHAGMDPIEPRRLSVTGWLPRSRGDGPVCGVGDGGKAMAPPLTRGWTQGRPDARAGLGGSPAHAGMDPLRRLHRAMC